MYKIFDRKRSQIIKHQLDKLNVTEQENLSQFIGVTEPRTKQPGDTGIDRMNKIMFSPFQAILNNFDFLIQEVTQD